MIRSRRLFGLASMLCLLGFALQVGIAGLARASEGAGRSGSVAQPYHQGPHEARGRFSIPAMPQGAEELLGLSVLAAILYGLRASGLSGESGRP